MFPSWPSGSSPGGFACREHRIPGAGQEGGERTRLAARGRPKATSNRSNIHEVWTLTNKQGDEAMKRILSCVAMMVVAFSVPALAAGNMDEGNGEIGVGVGNTQLDSNTGFDSATSLAVRGGYCFNKNFEIEGQLNSASESQDISGTSVDGTFRQYMVNGVYNFETPKAIVPYVMAG